MVEGVWTVKGALVLLLIALTMGLGGVLFGVAFRTLGDFAFTPAYVLKWAFNPIIIAALALGIGARLFSYLALSFINVSQLTLVSSVGIVATLVLARFVLDERLTSMEMFGSVLILAGVTLIGR